MSQTYNKFIDESETDGYVTQQTNKPQKRKQRIQKDHITKEQSLIKKQKILQQIDEVTYRVTTYNIPFEIALDKVESHYKQIFKDEQFDIDKSIEEKTVLIFVFDNQSITKICFLFEMGAIVLWGFTEQEEQFIQNKIENLPDHYKFQDIFLNKKKLEEPEPEIMFFTNKQNDQAKIIDNNDTIHLEGYEVSEKLAFSFAMAQSIKLYVYEIAVDEIIEQTKDIPRELADSGKIKLSQKEISRLQGQLFEQRSDINLNSNLLDSPEFFWNSDQYEKNYSYCRKWYNIPTRIKILNTRLDIIKELYDMLNDELHHQHENYLEWIIIWILVIEVAIELIWNVLIKDILGFFK